MLTQLYDTTGVVNAQQNSAHAKRRFQQAQKHGHASEGIDSWLITSDNLVEAAIAYYRLELNVSVQPIARKGGWPWTPIQCIRLAEHDLLALIRQAGDCNLIVMTGRTSQNLFILDCETRNMFERQCKYLSDRGIPLWASRSNSPKGGGHIWLRCSDGEIANIAPGKLSGMEVRGARSYILVPPAIHTKRSVYSWAMIESDQIPLVSIGQIDWLPIKLVASHSGKRAVQNYSPYSRKTQDFINNGASEGTRNRRLFEAACDVLGCDHDPEEILRDAARKCGLSDAEISQALKSAASEERTPSREPLENINVDWQRGLAWEKNHKWIGRTAQTDRKIWRLAICERARADEHKGRFRVSEREAAELAHVGRDTAHKALDRFIQSGYILPAGTGQGGARLFRFGKEIMSTHLPIGQEVVISTLEKGVLNERGTLGQTVIQVYQYLLKHGPKTARELESECSLSRRQVQLALDKSAKNNLTIIDPLSTIQVRDSGTKMHQIPRGKKPKRWQAIPCSEAELQRIAIETGAIEKSVKRIDRHNEERTARAYTLLEFAVSEWKQRKEKARAKKASSVSHNAVQNSKPLAIELSGESLYNEWTAFSNTDKRDDWYLSLPNEARWTMIDYKSELFRRKKAA